MKTLLITLDYLPQTGGVATYYSKLKEYWPEPDDFEVLDNNNHQLLNKQSRWPWLRSFATVYKKIKQFKPDHVLVGQILPLGTVCYFLSFVIKIKYSVIIHGMDFTFALKQRRKAKLAKKILQRANTVICGNNYTAGLVKEFIGSYQSKVRVVNPGIEVKDRNHDGEVAQLQKEYNLENKTVLFSLGRLVPRKGFDNTLKALKNSPNLVYVVAGGGPQENDLKELAKPLGQSVIFLGNLSNEDKWSWLCLCDIFIMPSREIKGDFEGFGIVYLEANSVKKPVIAGDSGGVSDAVKNNLNGLLIDPENIDEISQAITDLANNPEKRLQLGAVGYLRAKNEFNWQKQAQLFFNYIKN